jgi:hypothetical protein
MKKTRWSIKELASYGIILLAISGVVYAINWIWWSGILLYLDPRLLRNILIILFLTILFILIGYFSKISQFTGFVEIDDKGKRHPKTLWHWLELLLYTGPRNLDKERARNKIY